MWQKLSLTLLIGSLATNVAHASNVTIDEYRHPKTAEVKFFNSLYLDGLKDGLILFSVLQKENGQKPLFCVPPKLAVTVEQAEDIMLRFANKKGLPENGPVDILLLGGLKEAFPCNED
jgi:hypothetical protein